SIGVLRPHYISKSGNQHFRLSFHCSSNRRPRCCFDSQWLWFGGSPSRCNRRQKWQSKLFLLKIYRILKSVCPYCLHSKRFPKQRGFRFRRVLWHTLVPRRNQRFLLFFPRPNSRLSHI